MPKKKLADTANQSVKVTYPYLDSNINPAHLNFAPGAQHLNQCRLKQEYATKEQFGDKQILLYNHKNGLLGEGKFGEVRLGQDADTGE
jgi:hypothetical protein